MLQIKGFFSDGKTSKTHDAVLTFQANNNLTVMSVTDSQSVLFSNPADDPCVISSRLGSAPRVITFSSGATFTSNDQEAVDMLARATGSPIWQRLLPILEDNISLALAGAAIGGIIIWFTLTEGIPEFAKLIAYNLPAEVSQNLGKGTLEMLDEHYLQPSELSVSEILRLEKKLHPLLKHDNELPAQLIFRKSDIGANAFALPSQVILFTDDLVLLADNDDQLIAVLLHEIGHLQHRHILRRALQGSMITIVTILITGDVSGINELIAGIPTLLIDAAYSRDFEREADEYAIRQMMLEGIPVSAFEDILLRLQDAHKETDDRGEEDSTLVTDFLSSHPGTLERLNLIRAFSDRTE